MLQKIIAGFLGGVVYILLTWAGTLTGVLEWFKNVDPSQPFVPFAMLAPFSLMAFFIFASLYAHDKWQPQTKKEKTFGKLMIIGSGFAFGATLTQLLLMFIDGSSIKGSLIIAAVFFVTSICISLLICSFYMFLKPIRKISRES